MSVTVQALSAKILDLVGGRENVRSAVNCMTRLRVTLNDPAAADIDGLLNVDGILQVIEADTLHIVLGPGKAQKVTDQFKLDAGLTDGAAVAVAAPVKKQTKFQDSLKAVGNIFVPLIPGVITAGLCSGFAMLIAQAVPGYSEIRLLYLLHQFLSMIHAAFMTFITAWAGYRAAEAFGATPILGGMLGMITTMENINTVSSLVGLYNEAQPLDAILRTGRGGVLAVIFGVLLLAKVENWIRSKMPAAMDTVVSPVVILAGCVVPYVLVIMPITGILSNALASFIRIVCMSDLVLVRMIAGFLGASLFLPLVAMGMHHGLVALYAVQLETLGFITLYPALAMGGAGQVGAAVAIWLKARKTGNKRILSVIGGALPAGILGVGEPLIYGITLPMGKPFLTACLGAGFGGAFCMAMKVAATTWGPSGILALPIMVAGGSSAAGQILRYLISLVIAYIMGFLFTHFSLKDEEVATA